MHNYPLFRHLAGQGTMTRAIAAFGTAVGGTSLIS
jgi:hypothetical protein